MFKRNFINLCYEKGVKPTIVCKEIGINKSNYSQWTENTVPRDTTLLKIANYFNVTVEDLLKDDEEDKKESEDKMVIIAKKYKIKNDSKIIIEKCIGISFSEEEIDEELIPIEDQYPDDPDYSLKGAIAQLYVAYLRDKEIPVTYRTLEAILYNIKDELKKCKEIAKKDEQAFTNEYLRSIESEKQSSIIKLSKHEQNLIKAYRLQRSLQPAVDKLLSIDSDTVPIFAAAKSDDNHQAQITLKSKEKWEAIASAPETDQDLL